MGLGDTPDGRVPPSPNMFQKSPHTTSVELDPAAQTVGTSFGSLLSKHTPPRLALGHLMNHAKQRRLIEDGLARVAAAREQIASTPAHLTDDAATTSLEALLDEIILKQTALKEEQQALGINTPHTPDLTSPFATTRLLPSNTPPAERRLYFEQALANMEQTLLEMRDNLENHAEIAVPSSESGQHSHSEESVELDDVSTETDDGDPMSPRGIYMRRCAALTPEELEAEKESWKPYKRRSRIDFLGLTLFILFILATGFYAYTRIIFSLRALGPLLPYGVFILVLELAGAISIIFYGVWLIAVTDNSDIQPLNGEGVQLRRQYHVRVLVPCYKESLAIVRRTIIAARKATRPKGCAITIYLCDDGRKREKRQWVKSLEADDVIYVTGRPKNKGKTTNGKSENLNYSLKLIYPKKPDPGEQPNIPLTELMCLFDADQTCSVSFFENLLRYIDSGDDVAVALSPQLMHNIQPDCDIFNHQNVHFWEKMQPGMDALGFISLTGTNMILRSRALQACDWFPTQSVTEDWELGMRMKKLNWKCRYVPEYCAIGEAPEEVRNAFQQRSRWCKGHFQTFWSKQCPLVDSKLGIFYRLTYSSTCLSYISAGISVPVMTLVPIVTLMFGYFPINLNFWTVVGITVYYVVLNMLTYYCTSLKHFTALWLSNMATTIMFWPFLKAALFTPIKSCLGQGLTFKSTQKGSQTASASLKELGPSIILVILSIMALIVGFINFNVNVNAPKAIALCWVIFNLIPHCLLLIYARFGQGNFLTIVCKVFMILSSFVGLLALVLLWLLYPREENYTRAADLSLRYLEAQRSGVLPDNYNIPFRFTSGVQNVDTLTVKGSPYKAMTSVPVDATGGFYNEGEVGPVKITFNVALTTTMLAWSLLDFEDFWRRDAARLNAALELVNHGMQYIDSCYIPNPNPTNASSPNVGDGDIFVYLVGDIITERTVWRRPEDITEVQPIMYVTGIESPSDLASQISATLSSSMLALYQYGVVDAQSTQDQVTKAAALFKSAYDSPGLYTDLLNVTASGLDDHYDSTSASDDLFWAATWIFRATTMNFRADLRDVYYKYMQILKGDAYADLDIMAVTPDYMNNVAVVHAAVITRDDDFHSTAQSFLWDWICSGVVKYTTFGRGYYFKSPLLGSTVTAAALAAVYVYKTRQMDGFDLSEDFKEGFYCFAEAQGRYMLGTGFRKPMIIGFNKRTYRKTWDRSATCPTWPEACDAAYLLADRNDINPEVGALLWAPAFTDTINNRRGGNQTVISLENNWGMPMLWPGLELKGEPYMRCLQGQGAFLKHPVCKHKRPNAERGGPTEAPTVMAPEFQGLWKPATRPPTAPNSPPRAAG